MSVSSIYSPFDKHRGPHPGILAIVHVSLFAGSLMLLGILTKGMGFPNPFVPLAEAQHRLLTFTDATRYSAFLQFGAAVPLGLFTAAVTSRLSFLGVNVTGVSIALFGGIAASVFMTLSALCSWVLVQPGVADDLSTMHAIQLFGFATGGVAQVVALGLLMAGIAVPCLFGKYTPKWVAWLGLILAAIAELSTLSLLFPPLMILLPVARFGSYIWLIATGFTITKNRQ
ncbi:hypothetical protein J2T02_004986 [Chitinophaga terrae (ex Kim and Jung 2007)]|uniref:hypothetical protein n=1 Tax=Chitinophaga terrae (ex Kim and Jung 2007) TaxID=408074 RepID=UPI00277FE36D|nr:hypothetical protein [Chitinophaga terrae (ex Kim and Jung 2007)]MDQ0109841.1 hypothetical protein [Chitinophaga terrae (ex Kim and Jung 2007)]